jgi:hypothetical protein
LELSYEIAIAFTTSTGSPLPIQGRQNPLGFILPNGIPPTI